MGLFFLSSLTVHVQRMFVQRNGVQVVVTWHHALHNNRCELNVALCIRVCMLLKMNTKKVSPEVSDNCPKIILS